MTFTIKNSSGLICSATADMQFLFNCIRTVYGGLNLKGVGNLLLMIFIVQSKLKDTGCMVIKAPKDVKIPFCAILEVAMTFLSVGL